MEKMGEVEILRMLARGEVDLDQIAEALRSAQLVRRSYQAELEGLRRQNEQAQKELEKERKAVDDLAGRLTSLHEENRLARQLFQTEIEGKRSLSGVRGNLDLEALDMAALIRERENAQKALSGAFEVGRRCERSR